MSVPRLSDKGARYLGQLDQALCNGDWANIPELARKTEKHAPEHKGLTLAARTEAQIANVVARTATSAGGLVGLVTKLKDGLSGGEKFSEDTHIVHVCIAQIHWLQKDYQQALDTVPQDGALAKSADTSATAQGWLEVCRVKARLIKLEALEGLGRDDEARALGLESAQQTPGVRTAELRRWTERLLANICMLFDPTGATTSIQGLSQSLRSFMSWADFHERAFLTSRFSASQVPRRKIWKACYDLHSTILQLGLTYAQPPSHAVYQLIVPSRTLSEDNLASGVIKQRLAFDQAEKAYESLLTNETQFPKASQTNVEIEQWAQQVFSNWTILNDQSWTDVALHRREIETRGRRVLDILYRAATKTFHSTAILRYLFLVHAAVGEYDLVIHAFNSYVEIVSKRRVSAMKSGSHGNESDTDDIAISTAAEAVRILCRYGDFAQAEKAVQVGKTIQGWLKDGDNFTGENVRSADTGDKTVQPSSLTEKPRSGLDTQTLSTGYRAIGISQAHLANLTYDADARTTLQADALRNLRAAQTHDNTSDETGYALAMLLATMREPNAAAQVLKPIIASRSEVEDAEETSITSFTPVRKNSLVPLWHLLGLCLTATDDYEQGHVMLDAAIDLSEADDLRVRDDQLRNNDESSSVRQSRDRTRPMMALEGLEKASIVQTRLSQLIFVELTQGPEAALEMSQELFGLYTMLFGTPESHRPSTEKPPPSAASAAPSKLGGTLRSIAGSIRPKTATGSAERQRGMASTVSLPANGRSQANGVTNTTSNGVPFAITVTNENGVSTEKSRHHQHKHIPFWRKHAHHEPNGNDGGGRPSPLQTRPPQPGSTSGVTSSPASSVMQPPADQQGSRVSLQRAEPPWNKTSDLEKSDGRPTSMSGQEQPLEDTALPTPSPVGHAAMKIRLLPGKDRRLETSLLADLWLFTAGLYLRADLLDDASAAIGEASEIVRSFEIEVAAENSSSRQFFERGWGGGKSVDALAADIFSMRGQLAIANEHCFEAMAHFEQALALLPDHAEATIGLSHLLMNIYEEKMPAEEPEPLLSSQPSPHASMANAAVPPAPRLPQNGDSAATSQDAPAIAAAGNKSSKRDLTPGELNRLAARDRAYMLLSKLTQLGTGWDNAEAWSTIARAYELSGQAGKAKQALWWVVELEENEPMRPWLTVNGGGFTL